MTQAQILQTQIIRNLWSRLIDLTDKELMYNKYLAEETRDGKQIEAIKLELSRRIREA